jgi:ferredoxin
VAITRRELISSIAKAGVPAAVAITVGAETLHAETENIPVPSAAVGLLYDASICIGCKACVAACAEANDTPPDTRGDGLHQSPSDLNDVTRNIIKLYKPEDGSASSFVKRQCMQCLDRGMYRLPLLHYHLSLSHPAFSVAGVQPARDQVRVVQPPARERAEARMHQRLSHRRRDLRSAHRLAVGGQTPH